MIRSMLLLLTLILGPPSCAADIRAATLRTRDGDREALVARPAGPVRPGRPLVLLLHGHGGSAKHTLGQGRGEGSPLAAWLDIVDREGVVVAALEGRLGADGRRGWNDGRPGAVGNPGTDDVAFAREVVAQLRREEAIDPARVFAMGMSNGGVMTLRLAAEGDLPLAAAAAVCASLAGGETPVPARPVSILLIEGTEDPLMPYGGGQVRFFDRPRGEVKGTEATLAFWRTLHRIEGPPLVEAIPHRGGRQDPTRVARHTWGTGEGPQVQLLQVQGGGHAEPTLTRPYGRLYARIAGKQNRDLESAEEAWSFFRTKRALVSTSH